MRSWLESWGTQVVSVESAGALRGLLARPEGRHLSGVVVHSSAFAGGEEELWRLLAERRNGGGLATVLLCGWGTVCEEPAVAGDVGAARLRMPLRESELWRALGGGAETPRDSSLERLAKALEEKAPAGRLLVAEDNAVNQMVVRRMVEKLGYRAEIAGNGREAVEAFLKSRYDLILMDCQMPEMDGLQATAAIRAAEQAGQRVPIIALTAHATTGDREACLAAGMDDYLSKPLILDVLKSKLAQWMGAGRLETAAGGRRD